jgi:hypothetical protein
MMSENTQPQVVIKPARPTTLETGVSLETEELGKLRQ